jgi:alpha-glucosidase
VYLPGGQWYDFWTGDRQRGEITADAPLERMPIYVRAGAVLPLGPVVQHTDQGPPEFLNLHIYPGRGESWLFEDDGHSFAYRAGEFRVTRFVCESRGGRLRVHRQVDGPFDPGYERFEIYVHGLDDAAQQVLVDGVTTSVTSDPQTGSVRLAAGSWSHLEMIW